ncbi:MULTISPECIES: hypothetical protein [unclassified Bradyrhizobium]|uniref:hypothetical protein n=1 Tax=unclassified Bradyrhizobium TaxID=2631580 RepID=UPI00339AEFD8
MTASTAQTALLKARYFLSQAQKAESDVNALSDRLPFAANLEAAIVYARTSIEHLKADYSSRFNGQGYRRWHDQKWKKSDQLFHYFYERRNYILHQHPELTHAQVNVEVSEQITMTMSVSVTVIRADGSIEKDEGAAAESKPEKLPASGSSMVSHQFFFAEVGWGEKPALLYVEEFIEHCKQFISAAESHFG